MILSCESVDFVSNQLKLTFLLNKLIFVFLSAKNVNLRFFYTAIFVDWQNVQDVLFLGNDVSVTPICSKFSQGNYR